MGSAGLRSVVAGWMSGPAAEGVGEGGRVDVAQSLGDLGDGEADGADPIGEVDLDATLGRVGLRDENEQNLTDAG